LNYQRCTVRQHVVSQQALATLQALRIGIFGAARSVAVSLFASIFGFGHAGKTRDSA
jgi:hypothetical protein